MTRHVQHAHYLKGLLHCGACGSPTCASFAEDIVRGFCTEMDCIHLLKARLGDMAKQMADLAAVKPEEPKAE